MDDLVSCRRCPGADPDVLQSRCPQSQVDAPFSMIYEYKTTNRQTVGRAE